MMMSRNSMESSSPPSSTATTITMTTGAADQQQQQRLLRRNNPPADCDDDADHERAGRCLRRLGSSSRLADAEDGRWSWRNIYENVIPGQQQYGKLRKPCEEENIYENICEDCGRLYGAGRCGFCEDDESDRGSVASKGSGGSSPGQRFRRKYSAKFQEFLGNFRIRTAPGRDAIGRAKLSKSDIVHNVRGFEGVFRTNKSFDLGEICRMRDEEEQQQQQQHQLIGTEVDDEEEEEEKKVECACACESWKNS